MLNSDDTTRLIRRTFGDNSPAELVLMALLDKITRETSGFLSVEDISKWASISVPSVLNAVFWLASPALPTPLLRLRFRYEPDAGDACEDVPPADVEEARVTGVLSLPDGRRVRDFRGNLFLYLEAEPGLVEMLGRT